MQDMYIVTTTADSPEGSIVSGTGTQDNPFYPLREVTESELLALLRISNADDQTGYVTVHV